MNKFKIGQNVKVNLPHDLSGWHNMIGEIVEISYRHGRYLYGIKDISYVQFYEHELLLPKLKPRGHPLTNIFKNEI